MYFCMFLNMYVKTQVYKINELLENNHRIFVRFWTMSTMRPTRYNNTY